MNACEKFAALLDPYVDGELSPEEAARVRAHLETCGGCRSYVDAALAIRAAFPSVEDTAVPDGFAEGLLAAIQAGPPASQPETAPQKPRKTLWAKFLLPLAACCALVILIHEVPWKTAPAEAMSMDASESASTDGGAAAGDTGLQPFSAAPAAEEDAPDTAPARQTAPEDSAAPAPRIFTSDTAKGADTGGDSGAPADVVPSGEADAPAGPALQNAGPLTPGPAATFGDETDRSPTLGGGGETPAENAVEDGASAPDTSADQGDSTGEDAWVDYGNVVFSRTVFLTPEAVGSALEGFEGKPYSNANRPEDGVIGVGYALEQADFERILYDVLAYPREPMLNQDRTTELCCIIVTDDVPSAS